MSKTLKRTLLKTAGQHATLTYHRPFGSFTGSVEAALMLSQLLFWHRPDRDWIPVTDQEWKDLLGEEAITDYRLRKCRETLSDQGIVDTELRHHEGAPTHHYRLDMDALSEQWEEFTEREFEDVPEEEKDEAPHGPSPEKQSEEPPQGAAQEGASTEESAPSPPDDPDGWDRKDLLNLPPERVTPEIAKLVWNDFANEMRAKGYDIPRVRKLTDARQTWVGAKKEDLWPDMAELLDRIERSSHLRGENDRGWTVDFNWVWQYENNYTKILEGNYEDRSRSGQGGESPESSPQSSSYDSVGY